MIHNRTIKLTGIGTKALPIIFQDFTIALEFDWANDHWASVTAWKEYPSGKMEVACKMVSRFRIQRYLRLSQGIHGKPSETVSTFLPEFDGIWVNI